MRPPSTSGTAASLPGAAPWQPPPGEKSPADSPFGQRPPSNATEESSSTPSLRRRNSHGSKTSVLDGSNVWLQRTLLTTASSVVSEWYAIAIFRFFLWEIRTRYISPNLTLHDARLLAFSIFGTSLLLRPLGAIILGHISDSGSRIFALSISLVFSAASSIAIPFIPSYQAIGGLSTGLLVASQVVSGFAVGGQLPGAFVYTYESAPKAGRHFYVSLMQFQAVGGVAIAAFVDAMFESYMGEKRYTVTKAPTEGGGVHYTVTLTGLTNNMMLYPFLMSGVFALPGLCYLRTLNRAEKNKGEALGMTSESRQACNLPGLTGDPSGQPAPLKTLLQEHLLTTVLTMVACALWPVSVWLVFTWWQKEAPLMSLASCVLFACSAPIFAMVADSPTKFGLPEWVDAKKMIIFGAGLVALGAPFLIAKIEVYKSLNDQRLAVPFTMIALASAIYAGPLPAFLVRQFPKNVRFSGVAIGWGFTQAIFASTVGFVAEEIGSVFGPTGIGIYMAIIAVISLVGVFFLKDGPPQASAIASVGPSSIRQMH